MERDSKILQEYFASGTASRRLFRRRKAGLKAALTSVTRPSALPACELLDVIQARPVLAVELPPVNVDTADTGCEPNKHAWSKARQIVLKTDCSRSVGIRQRACLSLMAARQAAGDARVNSRMVKYFVDRSGDNDGQVAGTAKDLVQRDGCQNLGADTVHGAVAIPIDGVGCGQLFNGGTLQRSKLKGAIFSSNTPYRNDQVASTSCKPREERIPVS